jgi:hypothetical protein
MPFHLGAIIGPLFETQLASLVFCLNFLKEHCSANFAIVATRSNDHPSRGVTKASHQDTISSNQASFASSVLTFLTFVRDEGVVDFLHFQSASSESTST